MLGHLKHKLNSVHTRMISKLKILILVEGDSQLDPQGNSGYLSLWRDSYIKNLDY